VKIVYRAENIIDANLVKGALAQEGITAFVSGEYLTGAIGELPAWNLVAVMVADLDVERALPVAQAIDAALRQELDRPDACAGDALPA
jgi:putative signal transducing protein